MSHARRADWAATVPWSGILGKPDWVERPPEMSEIGGYGFMAGQIPFWNGNQFVPGNSGGGYSGPIVDSPLVMTGKAILGRSLVGTGEIEQITITNNLSLEMQVLDTIQNITVESTPTFAGIILSQVSDLNPATPSGTLLHVTQADDTDSFAVFDSFNGINYLMFRRADGTSETPAGIAIGEVIGSLVWSGYGSTDYSDPRAYLNVSASEAWTDSAQGTHLNIGVTPDGGTGTVNVATFTGDELELGVFLGVGAVPTAGAIHVTSSGGVGDYQLGLTRTSGATWRFSVGGGGEISFLENTTARLVIDSAKTSVKGALQLNNNFTAGAPAATGYLTLQDLAGNTYKVLAAP